MKKLAVITTIALLLGLTGMAVAQQDEDKPFTFGAKAGWFWVQDEPLSDVLEDNWSIGADVTYWFPQGFGIGAEVQYITRDEDEDISFGGADLAYEWTQIPINANAYYRLPMQGMNKKNYFYVGGGASFVFTDMVLETPAITVDTDDTVIGFNGKAGLQYGMFFVEGQYLWAEWDDEAVKGFFNEEDDINIGGFSAWIGIRF